MLPTNIHMLVDDTGTPSWTNVGVYGSIGEGRPRLEVWQIDLVVTVN